MDDTAATTTADTQDLESRFLAAVAQSPVPADECIAMVKAAAAASAETGSRYAVLLRDQLAESGKAEELAALYTVWAGIDGAGRPAPAAVLADLKRITKDRLWNAIADSCEFGRVDVAESMRRFNLLRACKPGTICLERTWGVGVIRRMDDFYKRATIDFASKKNHAMPFAIAGEKLSIPADSHILVQVYKDRAAYADKVRNSPGDVVRDALASFGPMTVTRLEMILAENKIVSEGDDWKKFWEAARKALKDDDCVEIPAKRSEPIVIHAIAPHVGDDSWFSGLAALRDPEKILEQVLKFESEPKDAMPSNDARAVIADRMKFAITGARNADHALYSRLAIAAARLGIEDPSPSETRAQLWREDNFMAAAEKLSSRDISHLVAFLAADGGEAVERLLAVLPSMNYAMAAETLDQLKDRGASDPAYDMVRDRVRELLSVPNPPQTILVWTLRNLWTLRDQATSAPVNGWALPSNYVLLGHALAVSEDPNLTGELLRMRNIIDDLITPVVKKDDGKKDAGNDGVKDDTKAARKAPRKSAKDWFQDIFATLEPIQQEAVFDHIRGSSSWEPATQRGMIGRMLKVNEGLKARKAASEDVADAQQLAGRWTSLRSRAAREQELDHLVKVDIPENVKAIEYGRSLGDLRENFEYQSAKDNERILHARREAWEEELRNVRGTDFASIVSPTVAGMGTRVTLAFADGSTRVCNILGEWDHDEALSIYSNLSGLARSLDGKKAGDAARIPTEDGERDVTVKSIDPLDDAVRAWINTIPEAPANETSAAPAANVD